MRIGFIWLGCFALAAAIIPGVWQGVIAGYPGDSFWTLSTFGRIGVVAISLIGLLLLTALSGWKTRRILGWSKHRWRIPIWLCDVLLTVLLFAVAFSVSPQIYYSFYQDIIAGLPDQWVIDRPLNWDRLRDIATPHTGQAMADHGAAIAVGGLVLFTAYLHRR